MKGTTMKPYTVWNFILDVVLFTITGGYWIIWIIIREVRRSNMKKRQNSFNRCNHYH